MKPSEAHLARLAVGINASNELRLSQGITKRFWIFWTARKSRKIWEKRGSESRLIVYLVDLLQGFDFFRLFKSVSLQGLIMNLAASSESVSACRDPRLDSAGVCAEQSRQEFERMFDAVRSEVYGFIDRRLNQSLRRRIDVSDVVQETQVVALQRYATYAQNAPMPFRIWLLKTAKQQLIQLYRLHHVTQKRTVTKEIAWSDCSSMLMAQHLAHGVSPSENLRREEMTSILRQAIDKLPEIDREILLMRHFENRPYEDIAILFEIQVDTARQRCGRALVKLRMVMRDLGLLEFPS